MAEGEDRLDRELIELLNELRVALPGVQMLFAFLLTLPFTSRFERISGAERTVYFTGLRRRLAAATALQPAGRISILPRRSTHAHCGVRKPSDLHG